MKEFAKIFKIPQGQVLLTKGYDSENDQYTLTQTAYSKGTQGAMTASFREEGDVNVAFDSYTLEDAKKYQKQLDKLLKS